MGPMSETDPSMTGAGDALPPDPAASTPGERRLAHPPSDRYRPSEPTREDAAPTDAGASMVRGIVLAVVAAIVGAVVLVVLGGILAVSAGLVVIAAATGWLVGAGLRFGAGDLVAPRRRIVIAVALAVAAVVVAQLGLWQYGLTEGGVLPLVDYLSEVYGPLVPLEIAAAAALAWLAAR
jgi:hypothetical protein